MSGKYFRGVGGMGSLTVRLTFFPERIETAA